MAYQFTSLDEHSVLIAELEGQITRSSIQQMLVDAEKYLEETPNMRRLLFDFTAITAIDLKDFAQAMTIFQNASPTFHTDTHIHYGIVETEANMNSVQQFLKEQQLNLPVFKSVDSAVTYFNLKADSKHISQTLNRVITSALETIYVRTLLATDPAPLHRKLSGKSIFPSHGILQICEAQGQRKMNIIPKGETLIGRRGSQRDRPAIDLTIWGAHEKGVSRTHAKIIKQDDYLLLVDLDSNNGTFLNGQHIPPDKPTLLNDGDTITFASLEVTINYNDTQLE